MTMAMISPSGREVSPAEQPRQNPRLVPPRFRLVAAEFRPRRWLMIFSHRKSPDSIRWSLEGHEVGGRTQGGRARLPPSWAGCGPPGEVLALNVFYILGKHHP